MFKSISNAKAALAAAAVPVSAVLMAAPAFASSTAPGVAITTDMLSPIIDGVTANIGVIMPVAIGIFAILLGVKLIPQIIGRFQKGN